MKSDAVRICFVLLVAVSLFSVGAFGKENTSKNGCWVGKYKSVGRNRVMTIEQFDSDLSVEIRDLDANNAAPPGDLVASFVAHVMGNVAKFRELRDSQNCQADLHLTPEGIRIEDRCGSPTGGVYVREN